MAIDVKLRNLRAEENISQEKMSDTLGVCQKTVSNYESGKSKLSLEQLAKIKEEFGEEAYKKIVDESLVINNTITANDNVNNAYQINIQSDEFIQSLKQQLKEKDEVISLLKDKVNFLEKELNQ